MKKSWLWLSGLLVALILPALLGGCSVAQVPASLDEQAQDIYRSLMCPLCSGQTIAESQSELSTQMRAVVREKLEQGETKEEILQFFVERYGEAVLAAPPKSGFNLLVWLAPITGIIAGAIVLWLYFRKSTKADRGAPRGPGTQAADSAGDEEYLGRLEEELKDFGEKGFR